MDLHFYCAFLTFWVNMLGLFFWKIKKSITITNAFQKILKQSNRKPNKVWVDKGSKFYNSSFQKWLQYNDIETYSIYQEGKSVVADSICWWNLQIHNFNIKKCVYR